MKTNDDNVDMFYEKALIDNITLSHSLNTYKSGN